MPSYSSTTLNLAGELPYYKWYTSTNPLRFVNVPGRTITDRIAAKKVEVDSFDAAATVYNDYADSYNEQFDEAKDLGMSLLDEIFENGYYGEKFLIPYPETYPTFPTPYSGPRYDSGTTLPAENYIEKIEDFGMGVLTADVLTVAAGGKSFGALGQGNLKDSAGVEIASTVTTYGSKLAKENTDSCDASYQVVTVIPKASETTKSFTSTFGSYAWKYNFGMPEPTVVLQDTLV